MTLNKVTRLGVQLDARMDIYHVPSELITHVLELSYFDEDGHPDRKTLKSCSLVCAFWKDIAQRLLFRSGVLTPTQCTTHDLIQLFSRSARGQLLASYVRRIDLAIEQNSSSQFYSFSEFLSIVSLFPQLYELVLKCSGKFKDPGRGTKSPFLPSLRSLEFYSESGPSFHLLYDLMLRWPTIQFLHISCRHFSPTPAAKHNLQLAQFSYAGPGEFTPDSFQWLIPDGRFLRILLVKARSANPRFLVERVGHHLRALHIPELNHENVCILSFCPNIEELDIMDAYPNPVHEECLLSKIIPPSVQHLRIRDMSISPIPVMQAIRDLPRLRVVTLPTSARGDLAQSPVWWSFEGECFKRGVSIVWNSHNACLRDDPVMVEKFPRGRSVSHFPLMN